MAKVARCAFRVSVLRSALVAVQSESGTGLPKLAPDSPVTTIAIECDGLPNQDTDYVRKQRPRVG